MITVLVVDDEKHIRKDLSKYLKKRHYHVYTAATVEEAIKIISGEKLDYALIDLRLDFASEFSGIKVFNFALKNKPDIKPIVLSSYPFQDVKEQLKKEVKEDDKPDILLEKIEEDYIYKGSVQNYILAVLDKLDELGQKKEKGGKP